MTTFDFNPMSPRYSRDQGWMLEVLPFIEEDSLLSRFDHSETSFSGQNSVVASYSLSLNSCPSAPRPLLLTGLSAKLGGPAVGGQGRTGDFVGSHGVADRLNTGIAHEGVVRVQIGDPQRIAYRDVLDGLSNTLLIWECARGKYASGSGARRFSGTWEEWQSSCTPWLNYHRSGEPPIPAHAASELGYLLSWAGANTGVVSVVDLRHGCALRCEQNERKQRTIQLP